MDRQQIYFPLLCVFAILISNSNGGHICFNQTTTGKPARHTTDYENIDCSKLPGVSPTLCSAVFTIGADGKKGTTEYGCLKTALVTEMCSGIGPGDNRCITRPGKGTTCCCSNSASTPTTPCNERLDAMKKYFDDVPTKAVPATTETASGGIKLDASVYQFVLLLFLFVKF